MIFDEIENYKRFKFDDSYLLAAAQIYIAISVSDWDATSVQRCKPRYRTHMEIYNRLSVYRTVTKEKIIKAETIMKNRSTHFVFESSCHSFRS